jgi:superfamily II DNA or RNA helicase
MRSKKKTKTEEIVQVIPFNFKSIKDVAKPGSWRRGYGYYRTKGQVLSVEQTDAGVSGKVKGNFKDAYDVQLIFEPDLVSAVCDCPLEEEWCKHAVSVGLTAIHKHLYEAYWNIPYVDDAEPCPDIDDTHHYEGSYRFVMDWEVKPKCVSLKVWDRRENDQILKLETVLKAAISLQQSGKLELTPSEKRELKLIQFLYKHAESDPKGGWFHVPMKEQEAMFEMLRDLEEVCHAKTNTLLRFETEPLHMVLSINASLAGNVLVSLHWHRLGVIEDVYPMEEIYLFGREIKWGYYNHHIFPLTTALRNLPTYLIKSSFYDLRDAEGGKFLFEELPTIRKIVEVEQAQIIDKASLTQDPPVKIVTMRRAVEETLIRAELEFSYDGTRVPYSKGHEAPYVTVTDKATETLYWLKRDKKAEEKAYNTLLKMHLHPLQTNHFEAEGDDAIDFIGVEMRQLQDQGWQFESIDDLSDLMLAPHPLRIVGKLDFTPENVDQFTMDIACGIGKDIIDMDTLQSFFTQGKKYINLEDKGYVEIPLAAILNFTKTLNCFDKETVGPDSYLIKTYQAGLITELLDQGVDLKMSARFKKFWKLVTSFNQLEEVDVPKSVKADLRPYQKQGFNWLWFLYSYGLNGILADDMGLGKTLQALVLLQKAKDEDGQMPTLVVCPTSVVYNWVKEAERFVPDLKILNLTGSERHANLRKIKESDIVITSYALVRRDFKILRQFPFRYVMLDESQNIKNYESQTAQAVKQLSCMHRLALSGTPIENRLSEVWSAFDFLMPGFLLDLDEFRYRYINPIEEKGNRDAERRLKKQLSPFILRRLKRDVAKDLPDKIENVSYCELLPEQRELYMEVLEQTREEVFAKYNAKGESVSQASILSALLRLRQVCCHPKLLGDFIAHDGVNCGKFEAMQDMIEEIISEGHRILFFSQFVEMLKLVRKWLEVKGIRHEYLTGETKATDRQNIVDRFNRSDNIPIMLISLKAGGTGLNLTGADYVIHYDPWWNPAVEEQATDRAHRIGQTKKVFVYRLITRGTVEEKIMKLQERKRNLVDSIISVDRDLAKKMSFEDLKEILTPDF